MMTSVNPVDPVTPDFAEVIFALASIQRQSVGFTYLSSSDDPPIEKQVDDFAVEAHGDLDDLEREKRPWDEQSRVLAQILRAKLSRELNHNISVRHLITNHYERAFGIIAEHELRSVWIRARMTQRVLTPGQLAARVIPEILP